MLVTVFSPEKKRYSTLFLSIQVYKTAFISVAHLMWLYLKSMVYSINDTLRTEYSASRHDSWIRHSTLSCLTYGAKSKIEYLTYSCLNTRILTPRREKSRRDLRANRAPPQASSTNPQTKYHREPVPLRPFRILQGIKRPGTVNYIHFNASSVLSLSKHHHSQNFNLNVTI